MEEIWSIDAPGVRDQLELFLYKDEALRQFVVYTYFNAKEEPLYIGCSKDYYDADYFNSERLSFFDEVEYVGFVFFDNEEEMKDAKKYFIRAREPKYSRSRYEDLPVLEELKTNAIELVVLRKSMLIVWKEWFDMWRDPEEKLLKRRVEQIMRD